MSEMKNIETKFKSKPKMKKINLLSVVTLVAILMAACSSDDRNLDPKQEPGAIGEEITKAGKSSEDEPWTGENVYVLDGKVVVSEGATLTIEPGTIIKGAEGQESLASALVVDQG